MQKSSLQCVACLQDSDCPAKQSYKECVSSSKVKQISFIPHCVSNNPQNKRIQNPTYSLLNNHCEYTQNEQIIQTCNLDQTCQNGNCIDVALTDPCEDVKCEDKCVNRTIYKQGYCKVGRCYYKETIPNYSACLINNMAVYSVNPVQQQNTPLYFNMSDFTAKITVSYNQNSYDNSVKFDWYVDDVLDSTNTGSYSNNKITSSFTKSTYYINSPNVTIKVVAYDALEGTTVQWKWILYNQKNFIPYLTTKLSNWNPQINQVFYATVNIANPNPQSAQVVLKITSNPSIYNINISKVIPASSSSNLVLPIKLNESGQNTLLFQLFDNNQWLLDYEQHTLTVTNPPLNDKLKLINLD